MDADLNEEALLPRAAPLFQVAKTGEIWRVGGVNGSKFLVIVFLLEGE